MNWNREVSKNLEQTKIGIKDWRDTAERRHVLKQARRWARWQRDQLRTPEAIELVAGVMFEDDNGETIEDHLTICLRPKECPPVASYKRQARLAINALLGED